MAKKKWLPYLRTRYYKSRSDALAEAKRLRKIGHYRARVRKTTIKKRPPWTLWVSRRER